MSATLPTLFLSHGSPMHAVRAGDAGTAWAALAHALAALGRLKANLRSQEATAASRVLERQLEQALGL